MEKREPEKIKLVVVEAWEPCNCHLMITAREANKKVWHNFFVKQPPHVGFGDILSLSEDYSELILERGPYLDYTLKCDPIPDTILTDMMSSTPYEDMDLTGYKDWSNGW